MQESATLSLLLQVASKMTVAAKAWSIPPRAVCQIGHRCVISCRDVFHVSSVGGFRVPRIAHHHAVVVQGVQVTRLPHAT